MRDGTAMGAGHNDGAWNESGSISWVQRESVKRESSHSRDRNVLGLTSFNGCAARLNGQKRPLKDSLKSGQTGGFSPPSQTYFNRPPAVV